MTVYNNDGGGTVRRENYTTTNQLSKYYLLYCGVRPPKCIFQSYVVFIIVVGVVVSCLRCHCHHICHRSCRRCHLVIIVFVVVAVGATCCRQRCRHRVIIIVVVIIINSSSSLSSPSKTVHQECTNSKGWLLSQKLRPLCSLLSYLLSDIILVLVLVLFIVIVIVIFGWLLCSLPLPSLLQLVFLYPPSSTVKLVSEM